MAARVVNTELELFSDRPVQEESDPVDMYSEEVEKFEDGSPVIRGVFDQ